MQIQRISVLPMYLVLTLAACQPETAPETVRPEFRGLEAISDTELRNLITRYYRAETRHDWAATYALRRREFRGIVTFARYKKEMERGIKGWALLRIDILKVSPRGDTDLEILMRFREKIDAAVARKLFDGKSNPGGMNSNEHTVWRRGKGGWEPLALASRSHLHSNHRIVY